MAKKPDTASLTNDLIYHRYLMDSGQLRQHLKDLNIPEYLALHIIAEAADGEDGVPGRTYLSELAGRMRLTIRQSSRIVRALRDKGLVLWAHDGNGKDGTYVILTEAGRTLMERQEERLKGYYGRVIETYGKDNMVSLLRMVEELETVMLSELKKMEAIPGGDGTAEEVLRGERAGLPQK